MTFVKRLRRPAAAALCALAGIAAQAQPYPAKAITLLIPFPPGGSADVVARLLTQEIKLGQPFVIDYRPGAAGTLGASLVAKASADGYTLLFVTAGHAGSAALYPLLPGFDASAWAGILAPKGTPPAVVDRLAKAFGTALRQPLVQERMKELAFDIQGSPPAEFGHFVDSEADRWSAVIRKLGLKAD